MFEVSFEIEGDVLDAWINQLEQTPRAVNDFMQVSVRPFLQRMVDEKITSQLTAVGPVVYGWWPGGAWLEWKSPRQRAYVHKFILKHDAAGNTIPYRRTGALAAGMKVEVDLAAGTVAIVNRTPGAEFVIGEYRQPFHRNTGWPDVSEDAFNIFISSEVEDLLITGWLLIVDIPILPK